MKELTAKDKQIIAEWKKREEKYDHAKQELKAVLAKYGIASSEFSSARIDFEMIKEEFDNFEKENHKLLAEYRFM